MRKPWLVPVVVALVCWALTTHGKYSDSGDEPHYLMVMQSLVTDGDLDLSNNYAEHQGRVFGADALAPGQHIESTLDGRMFPVHDIGLPVLLAPVYLLATHVSRLVSPSLLQGFRMTPGLFAYSIISLFMIAIASTAAAIARSALIETGIEAGLASGAVLVAWLSPPVLSNSFLVFPEVIALCVTAAALRVAVTRSAHVSRGALFAVALSLGCLPWFHRKYVIYGAALFVVVLWRLRTRLPALSRIVRALLVLRSFCRRSRS